MHDPPCPPPPPQDLLTLYNRAGVKNTPIVFLITDNQVGGFGLWGVEGRRSLVLQGLPWDGTPSQPPAPPPSAHPPLSAFPPLQIVKEQFLVYINDLLATGYSPDLCSAEERDAFCAAMRNEAKAAGVQDTPDTLWEFFLDKVCVCVCVGVCVGGGGSGGVVE